MTGVSREAVLARVASPMRPSPKGPRTNAHTGTALTEDEIGYVIEGLAFSQRPIRAATKEVTEHHDLGPRGTFILALVAQGVTSPMELASVLRVGRSLITAELVRLTNAGLVTSTEGVKDRRRLQLSLTEAGQTAREKVRSAMGQIVTENLAAYTPDEIRLFAQMLHDTRQGLTE